MEILLNVTVRKDIRLSGEWFRASKYDNSDYIGYSKKILNNEIVKHMKNIAECFKLSLPFVCTGENKYGKFSSITIEDVDYDWAYIVALLFPAGFMGMTVTTNGKKEDIISFLEKTQTSETEITNALTSIAEEDNGNLTFRAYVPIDFRLSMIDSGVGQVGSVRQRYLSFTFANKFFTIYTDSCAPLFPGIALLTRQEKRKREDNEDDAIRAKILRLEAEALKLELKLKKN